jgi:autotransporter-associated beta strand protein
MRELRKLLESVQGTFNRPHRLEHRCHPPTIHTTMKTKLSQLLLLGAALAVSPGISHGQTATWTAGGGNSDWNNDLNWDTGTPLQTTNASIGGGAVVDYNTPMAAPDFAGVLNSGTLSINAAGFNIDALGQPAYTGNAASLLRINAGGVFRAVNAGTTALTTGSEIAVEGGVLIITNTTGNFTLGVNGNNAGAGFTNNGGTVIFSQPFQSRGASTRFVMTGGSLKLLAGGGIFEGSNDQNRRFYIGGGTVELGDFSTTRTANGVAAAGLVISNGTVTATSLRIGVGNSAGGATIAGGVLTNTGVFTINDRNNSATTGERRVFFYVRGGSVYSSGSEGIIVGNQGNATAATSAIMGGFLDVNAGLVVAEGITLVKDTSLANVHGTFTLGGSGQVYLGSVGLNGNVGVSGTSYTITHSGGTLGAKADFAINGNVALSGTTATIKAADLANTPHNITHNGTLTGAGALTKTGGGTLTLNAANTYSGITTINAGTLALGAAATLPNTPQIQVASGATFNVAAPGGYTVAASRTLAGSGTVVGDITVASGGTVNPGSNTVTGTLTITGALTQSGGAVNHFELPNTPGPTNDRLVISGDLNVSGVNTLEVVGGGSPGNVHVLIQYGGAFNGTLANFTLTGASGILTNNTVNKTIGFVVTTSVRSPGSVVWVGNPINNDWDVINRTNWSNGGVLDYFVTGDNVLFNALGAANPNVNLIGNVAPASVTVGAAGNYTFGGAGSITGTGALLKTNTGTLTLNTVNAYTGPTLISNGVVEVATLANGGQNSSIGASDNGAGNLVVDGATLRYSGATATTDRAATLGANHATLGVNSGASTLTVNGSLGGDGRLTKIGDGTLVLGSANTYAGGSVINAGTLQFNNAAGGGAGGITNNGAALRLNGAIVLNNLFEFNGNCALVLSGVGGGNVSPRGSWTGSGYVSVTFLTQNPAQVFTIGGQGNGGGHMWDFAGTVDFGANDGFCRINNDNSNFNFGSSNATFNVGTGTATLHQRNGGTTTHFGALIGGPSTKLAGRGSTGTSGTTTYSIGNLNTATLFEGEINNGSGTTAIIKIGTGKLTLTGTSIYTGATTIENGILQVDGALGNTFVNVNGGTLAGNGSMGGSVNVNAGGTLAPGASIGQLTFNGFLSLGGNTVIEVNKGVGNDAVIANAGVNYGGTLTVNNIGGALSVGDSFQVFTGSGSGDFASIAGSPGTGLAWSFDPNTGLLSVVSAGVVLSVSQTGNSLEFSWTDATYQLQAQTNTLNVGLGANWADYPGGSTSPVTVPINKNHGAVFFRLFQLQP